MAGAVAADASTEVLRFAQDDSVQRFRNDGFGIAGLNHRFSEGLMQVVITFMAVVAGLIFSVAVALLAEEFIFGQVFRLFFVQQPVRQAAPVKSGQKR
jgi:hypothetical protein